MTTPNPEITAVTLRAMRAKLEEAAAIAGAAEGCAVDGQASRALTIALDVEPLAIEADQLLQGLAVLSRVASEEQDETEGLRCRRHVRPGLPAPSKPSCPRKPGGTTP
jgi:hypothetical protein